MTQNNQNKNSIAKIIWYFLLVILNFFGFIFIENAYKFYCSRLETFPYIAFSKNAYKNPKLRDSHNFENFWKYFTTISYLPNLESLSWIIQFKDSNAISWIRLAIYSIFYLFLTRCNFIQLALFWYEVNINILGFADQFSNSWTCLFIKKLFGWYDLLLCARDLKAKILLWYPTLICQKFIHLVRNDTSHKNPKNIFLMKIHKINH